MTTTVVTSGNVVSGAVLNNNDLEQVTQAGSAVDTTVNSGGELDVFGQRGVPGTASGTVINNGGLVDDSAGALFNTTVNAGGTLTVENNATASGTVMSGTSATMLVINNSIANATTVQNGAVMTVAVTGTATGTTLDSGGRLMVSGTSAVAGGTTVQSGGVGSATNGGNITGAAILNGGLVDIGTGGIGVGNAVSSGGFETVEGVTSGTAISTGGQQIVSSGGIASGTQVQSGGTQVISAGGVGVYANVIAAGQVVVSSAGSSLSARIGSGGSETVLAGGLAQAGSVFGGGLLTVSAAGSAVAVIADSGTIDLKSGAHADATTVYHTGTLLVEGGAIATGGVLAVSGLVDVFGLVSGLTQQAGVAKVESGGTLTSNTLQGGLQTVMSGGVASATIQTGGIENILAGGTEIGASVGGGVQNVYGVASAVTVYYGGSQVVSGQTVSTVLSGGFEQVASGAVVSGTRVFTGAEQILSGGSSVSAVFSMGGQDIRSGGVAIGAVISAAGQTVSGTAINTVISTGDQTVFGLATGTTVLAGGNEYVSAGGVASGTNATGRILVTTGGTTVNASLSGGGVELVYAGGQALVTTIGSGGTATAAGGTFSGATVQSSGSMVVSALGVASATTLLAGGSLSILSGGTAAGGTISGGNETVFSGGIDRSATVLSGAVITVASSGVASGTLVLAGGSQAILLSGTASGALLSGGTQFVSSAGIARATSVFAGGDQEVLGGAQVSGTAVSSGGTQTVNSGGVASATTVFAGGTEVINSAGLALNAVVSSGGTLLVSSGATATGTLLSAGGVMVNHGSTSATNGAAVSGVGGGAIVNNDGYILGASLSTGVGISVAGGTVTNAGTIIGLGGTAIAFGGTTTNRLIVTSASVISGLVSATSAAANTLELSGSTGVNGATLAGYTAQYLGFQSLQVDAGSTWEVSGTSNVGALINDGGLLVKTGDATSVGAVSGAGNITVSGTGVLSIGGSVSASQTITFSGTTAKVLVADASGFAGTVANFARGDIIDLTGVNYAGATATLSGNTITVVNAAASSYTITLAAAITTSDLRLSADAGNHLQVTLAPQLTEALNNDTGASPTDTITSDATLAGNTDANASVVLREGGTVLGTTTSDNAGHYSFTPTLADGVHTVTATVTDANGFTATRTSTFTLDTTAPAAPTVGLTLATDSGVAGDGLTKIATPTLTGIGENGATVVLTEGGAVLGTATVANGTWTIPLSSALADGSHTLLATQTDRAGNSSSTGTTLVIDTVAPAAPALSLAAASDSGTAGDNLTNVTRPSITGTGTAGDTVNLFDNGTLIGSGTVDGTGHFSVAPTAALADGTHPLTAVEVDPAANASTASAVLSLTVDTVADAAPTGLALDPADDSGVQGDKTTNVAQPHLTGGGTNGDTVTLFDGATLIGTGTVANNAFSIVPTAALAVGNHSLTAVQTDAAGNASVASAPYVLTVTGVPATPAAPALAAASDSGAAGDRITNVAQPTVTGTVAPGATVSLYEGNTALGTATASGDGTYSIALGNALSDGVHALTVTQTDVSGTVSAVSAALSLTIDTVADAAPTGLTLAPASDSGTAGDDITNATRPSITGSGTAGDTLRLLEGTTVLGTATVDGAGHFAVAPLAALADGVHQFTAEVLDAAGNVSAASAALAVTIATTLPATPATPTLDPGSDSGSGSGSTNVNAPVINGTGTAGNTVAIYDGNTVVGTGTVDGTGHYAVTLGTLADGAHTLVARQTDTVGNQSNASSSLALVIDTVAPLAPALSLAAASDSGASSQDRTTNVAIPVITGTAESGTVVTLYDGATLVGTATAANGVFAITPPAALSDGVHALRAIASDAAGNVSAQSAPLSVTIDTVADAAPSLPALAVASDSGVPGDALTNVNTPSITGSGVAGDVVTLYDGSVAVGTATVGSGGDFSVAPSAALADGVHAFTTRQADLAGNVSAASGVLNVTIDTVADAAPSAPVMDVASDSGVAGDDITNVARPTFTGTGVAGSTATLFDGTTAVASALIGPNGSFSLQPGTALGEGLHALTVRQTDAAGNVSTASSVLPVTIDVTAPAVSAPALSVASDSGVPGDGLTNVASPTITGTGEAGATVTLFEGATVLGTGVVGAGGTYAITPSVGLADGVHGLTVSAQDAAGNVSAASAELAFTVDTAADASPATLALAVASDGGVLGDGLTDVAAPTITGTGVSGDTVTLRDGATVVGTAVVAGDGTWSIVTSQLADGVHGLSAVQTDPAGNVSAASGVLPVTVDTVADAAPGRPVLAAASDGGLVGDGLTDVAAPTITGTGVAGSTVTLRDGATVVGTAVVAGNGTWSIVTSTLADGSHGLSAVQTDAAGNVSAASGVLPVMIDTVADAAPGQPVLAAASDSGLVGDGLTNVAAPTITGTGVAGSTVTLRDGATVVGTAVVAGNGIWSIVTSQLADGVHGLSAVQTDPAGNVSAASGVLPVTVQTEAVGAPAALALAVASDSGVRGDGLTSVAAPTITGTGVSGDTVTLRDGATVVGTAVVAGDGTWSIVTSQLADGVHGLSAVQTDPAGSVSAASGVLPVTVDTVADAAPGRPVLAAASDGGIVGDGLTNVVTPTITGTGVAGSTVTLRDGATVVGTAVVTGNGTWSVVTSTLADGSHGLSAVQTDAAGNVSATSGVLPLTVQTTAVSAPAALALAVASDSGLVGDGITNVAAPTITGTGVAGDTVTLRDGATVVGTAVVSADGTWSASASRLADGLHTLSAVQTDAAGTVSAASMMLPVTVQTAVGAPAALALALASDSGVLGDGLTNAVTPTITGTGVAGDTVTLRDGTIVIGAGTVAADGTWSITTSRLANGLHSLTARQTDQADNNSAVSSPLLLRVQTAAPAAPGSLALAAASDSGVRGDGITNVVAPTITGTGVAGDTVTLLDGNVAVGTAEVAANGTWSVTASQLANGLHAISAVQTDVAGNASAAGVPLTLRVITGIPATPGSLALAAASDSGVRGDGITNVVAPTITGTGVAGDTVTLLDGAAAVGTGVVAADGTWSVAASQLSAGLHAISAVQTDVAGNASAAGVPLALRVITGIPAAPGSLALAAASDSGVGGDGITNVTAPTITGTGVAGDTVTLLDGNVAVGTAVVAANGTWSVTASQLANGLHGLVAQQSDVAGNVSDRTAALPIQVDATIPATPTVTQSALATGAGQPVLVGTADSGDVVAIYQDGTQVGSAVAADGKWSYAYPTALAAGGYSVTAIATNAAGTASAVSGRLGITVAADSSYTVTVPSSTGTTVQKVAYSAAGTVDRVDTSSSVGTLLTSVTNTTALINIYDTAGTLIGTIVQPSTSAFHQPVFDTTPANQAANTASGQTGSVVNLLSETNDFVSQGNDTITVHSGTAKVAAMGPTTVVTNIAADLTFYGNDAATQVYGGSGTVTAIGGTGGATLIGGTAGNNVLVAGGGTSTLVAVADGDVLFGSATGTDTLVGTAGKVTLVAGAGNETLVAHVGNVAFGGAGQSTLYSGAEGGSILVGGDGTSTLVAQGGNEEMWGGNGFTTIWGGSGHDVLGGNGNVDSVTVMHGGGTTGDLFIGGAGTDTAYGSKGSDTFWSGSGAMFIYQGDGNNTVGFGTGATTVFGGAGANLYAFINGVSGGQDMINNFKVGTDHITLTGYDPASVRTAVVGGSTVMTLSDNTLLTLTGVTSLRPDSIV